MSSGAPDRELVESALSLLREARTVMAAMDEENAYLAERAGTQATKLLDERCVWFAFCHGLCLHDQFAHLQNHCECLGPCHQLIV
jgi:hypothetical protein